MTDMPEESTRSKAKADSPAHTPVSPPKIKSSTPNASQPSADSAVQTSISQDQSQTQVQDQVQDQGPAGIPTYSFLHTPFNSKSQSTLNQDHHPAEAPVQPQVLPPFADGPAIDQHDDLEADDNEALERDSAFGDNESVASSKTSLTSGITKYRQENGRRYHAYRDGKYLLPNDEIEQDRLDLGHHVFTLLFEGKLFHAPVENFQRVLDAGTGTGIWAIDFADQHPEAHVIGSDLSPIQPGWIPPNLEFEVDDIEDTWKHRPFTYIHMRMMSGSIKDWPALIAQAYANLEPGGWLEFLEFEVWVHTQNDEETPFIMQWQSGLRGAGDRIGRTFDVAPYLKRWMEEAGFVGVREMVTKCPNSPWPKDPRWKEIGLYQQQNMLDACSSYGQAHFTRVLGWSPEEFMVLSANVRKEIKNLRLHIMSNLYTVYGQKPKDEGV